MLQHQNPCVEINVNCDKTLVIVQKLIRQEQSPQSAVNLTVEKLTGFQLIIIKLIRARIDTSFDTSTNQQKITQVKSTLPIRYVNWKSCQIQTTQTNSRLDDTNPI